MGSEYKNHRPKSRSCKCLTHILFKFLMTDTSKVGNSPPFSDCNFGLISAKKVIGNVTSLYFNVEGANITHIDWGLLIETGMVIILKCIHGA